MWIAAAVFLVLVVWLYNWCQPERQVRRAQGRLLAAAESGDFDSLAQLIAEEYSDGWGHDKAFVLRAGKEVFSQFVMIDITREDRGAEGIGDRWVLREKLTMQGLGQPLAVMVRDRVNRLTQPFTTQWRKKSWKPWDWELTGIEHPEITEAEMNLRW